MQMTNGSSPLPPHSSSLTLHQRILGDIEGKILSGEWAPGSRLPTEHELCTVYSCSRMTVNKVLTQLATAGLIERRKRAGSFVLQPRSQAAVLDVHDVRIEVEALGRSYAYRLLSSDVRDAADEWGEVDGGPVRAVAALHLAAGRPFCYERRSISLLAVPEAETADFSEMPPSTWLLLQVPWTVAEHRIRAIGADDEVASVLGIPVGTPCLEMERRTWNMDRPVTLASMIYPGSAHSLIARFSPS